MEDTWTHQLLLYFACFTTVNIIYVYKNLAINDISCPNLEMEIPNAKKRF